MNTPLLHITEKRTATITSLLLFLATSAFSQLAPAGSIYVQQPAGVHYFFGTAGSMTGGGFFYVDYQASQYDVISPITVSSNGSFSGTSPLTSRSITGQVGATTISFTYNGKTISSAKEAPYGPTQKYAGGYNGTLTNSSLGVFVATLLNTGHGVSLGFDANNSGVAIGVGTISTSGAISITTLAGEHVTTQFNPINGLAQGTAQSSYGYVYNYALAKVGVPRLANIATRGLVGSGEQVLIGGFIIKDGGKLVLIDAKGPSLAARGVSNPVQNPKLDLYLGNQLIASNADWRTNANAADIAASGAGPTDDREAALQVALEPGAYTVIISSEDSSQGIGIVEIYGID